MKRTKTLTSFFTSTPTPSVQPDPLSMLAETVGAEVDESLGTEGSNANDVQPGSVGVGDSICLPEAMLNADYVVADPGLRIPFDQLDPNIRDVVRRAYIAQGPCQPKGHKYPKRKIVNRNRSFHDQWFTNHPWLEYSVAKDAAYCFYCYLFKQPRAENYGIHAFTAVGFRGWKDGTKLIDAHAKGIDHNKARKAYEDFKNQSQSVCLVMDRGGKKMEEEYKGCLTPILGVVRFLLLQALDFHGHDESTSSSNKGNFLEMLEWYKNKDQSVANLLRSSQMTSLDIQKHISRACAEKTTRAIISEIGDRNFAILVDGAQDASFKEHMAVVLRYVNEQGEVVERFLGLQEVPDSASSSLKDVLDGMFSSYGLSMSRLRGQGCDGASNMRGEFHGLQRRILDENPYAYFMYCFAHQLKITVVSVAKCCSSVFDFFQTCTMVVNTVNACCKRSDPLAQEHYENLVNVLETGEMFLERGKQENNLVWPEDTRWGSFHKTLCRIVMMWNAILEVLEIVADDGCCGDKKCMASGLLERMESFEFVFILHLLIGLLGKTNDLSQCLQRKDQIILRVPGLIGATLRNINKMRENGWEELLEKVNTFCTQHNIIIPNMEDAITVRGRSRGLGGKLVTYYHHFKYEIFNVVYDQVIVELNNHFTERATQLLRCIASLDPRNFFASYDKGELIELAKIYSADFSQYDLIVLGEQLDIFIADVRGDPNFANCQDLGKLAIKMVQTERHKDFSLVYRLIELALILPVATATVERAFSAMKLIKAELRNKIGNDWLTHRMICYIERDIFASIKDEDILYHFKSLC